MSCAKQLLRGTDYMVGELRPLGFGLWDLSQPAFPIRMYPGHLDGWFAAIDEFHALGQTAVRPRRRSAAA